MTFTPIPSLIGGLMLSFATSTLLTSHGRVLGVSGIAHAVLSDPLRGKLFSRREAPQTTWKAACLFGFLAGGLLLRVLEARIVEFTGGAVFDAPLRDGQIGRTILAGLLVGVGTKIGSGCTSGHMLGGLARLSLRSIVATITFFVVATVVAQAFPANMPDAPPPAARSSSIPLATIAILQIPALLYTSIPFLLPAAVSTPITAFLIGAHFTFGLALAGMTQPSKVLSFFYAPTSWLPLYGKRDWDPSLSMVAIGGLLPSMLVWRLMRRRATPLWSSHWELPTKQGIDLRLVGGSILFGAGWGLSGLCPGPAFAVLGSLRMDLVPFVAAFIVGGVLGGAL